MEKTNENQKPFFVKGRNYRCIKDVVINKSGRTAFKAGTVYKQACEPTCFFGWLSDERGERHAWPQPERVKHEAMIWGSTPESMDSRLYFEPVK